MLVLNCSHGSQKTNRIINKKSSLYCA